MGSFGHGTLFQNDNIESPGKKVLAITARAIKRTGSKASIKLSNTPGKFFVSISILSLVGIAIFILCKTLPNNGPAIITTSIEIALRSFQDLL